MIFFVMIRLFNIEKARFQKLNQFNLSSFSKQMRLQKFVFPYRFPIAILDYPCSDTWFVKVLKLKFHAGFPSYSSQVRKDQYKKAP